MSEETDLRAFRAEMRTWLDANAPAGVRNLPEGGESICWGGKKWKFASADQQLWLERASAKGYSVPEWPTEYGGAGMSATQARILHQEMRRLGIRKPVESLGIWMLGPALLRYGSEAQKREHLPRIARGEIRWAQGYSEPGAGSDLASLTTRCEDKGDHYLVNGSKIWTSYGDKCDWIFALVRTDPSAPKHQGISFLLIDMESPGVSTSPIRLISGESPFTSTFFDDVRVPRDNLVSSIGKGWEIARYLLQHEREMIGSIKMTTMGDEALSARSLKQLGAEWLRDEGALRADLIRYETDRWALDILTERVFDMGRAGQSIDGVGSILKVAGTELLQRQAELLMTVSGVEGLSEGSNPAFDWLHAPIGPIAGGSNEIQLNVISKRALSLPEK